MHKRRVLEDVLLINAEQRGIVEDPVPASNRGLSGGKWVPGKAQSRSEVGLAGASNLAAKGRILPVHNNPIERIEVGVGSAAAGARPSCADVAVAIDGWSLGGIIEFRIKVGERLICVRGLAEKGVADTIRKSQIGPQVPLVLHVEFELVGFDIRRQIERNLGELGDKAGEKIRKRLFETRGKKRWRCGRVCRSPFVGEGERSRVVAGRVLRFLVVMIAEAGAQAVTAEDFADIGKHVVVAVEVPVLSKTGNARATRKGQGWNAAESIGKGQSCGYIRRPCRQNRTGGIADDGAGGVSVPAVHHQGRR